MHDHSKQLKIPFPMSPREALKRAMMVPPPPTSKKAKQTDRDAKAKKDEASH